MGGIHQGGGTLHARIRILLIASPIFNMMYAILQAMHAEAQAQDPDITAAQDKMDPLHTNVRKTARQAFNYVHRL